MPELTTQISEQHVYALVCKYTSMRNEVNDDIEKLAALVRYLNKSPSSLLCESDKDDLDLCMSAFNVHFHVLQDSLKELITYIQSNKTGIFKYEVLEFSGYGVLESAKKIRDSI